MAIGSIAALRRRLPEFRDEKGQGLVEYALIISVVALGTIAALVFLRDEIKGLFSKAGSSIRLADGGGTTTPPGPTAPGAPTGITLLNGGGHLNGYINIANEDAVDASVALPVGTYGAGWTVTLVLSDGAGPGPDITTTLPIPGSATSVAFNNIDTSPSGPDLADGAIAFTATITGPSSTSSPTNVNFTRDTDAPAANGLTIDDGGGDSGRPQNADFIDVTFDEAMLPSSICGAWSGTGNQGPTSAITVRLNETSGDDELDITSAGACTTLNFGVIDLDDDDFTGSDISYSTSSIQWTTGSNRLRIVLGGGSSGSDDDNGQDGRYTPSSSMTDLAGNPVTGDFDDNNERYF